MKAVMLMFDTLTRNHLAPYGGDAITPNFTRLAQESAQFDRFYVGSMPCMPARRELHTGRYNFCIVVGVLWSHTTSQPFRLCVRQGSILIW